MVQAWRIVKAQHSATGFSGEGARRYGGRWNSPTSAVVYTSNTKFLAALECLVHLDPLVLFTYVAFCVEFAESCIETIPPRKPLLDWRVAPAPLAVQTLGNA